MKTDLIIAHIGSTESPFRSKKVLVPMINFVWICFFVLLFVWPKRSLYYYIKDQSTPYSYIIIFEFALLFIGFINLRCGNGELYRQMIPIQMLNQRSKQTFHYQLSGFIKSIFHVVFTVIPITPILIIAALLTGIRPFVCLISIILILLFSVLLRLSGTMTFLVFGPIQHYSLVVSRLLYLIIIGGVWFISPVLSPVQVFIYFHSGKMIDFYGFISGLQLLIVYVLALITFFLGSNLYLIRKIIYQHQLN